MTLGSRTAAVVVDAVAQLPSSVRSVINIIRVDIFSSRKRIDTSCSSPAEQTQFQEARIMGPWVGKKWRHEYNLLVNLSSIVQR